MTLFSRYKLISKFPVNSEIAFESYSRFTVAYATTLGIFHDDIINVQFGDYFRGKCWDEAVDHEMDL